MTPNTKNRKHSYTMTDNRHDKQTISTKGTDFQPDRILLLGQITEKKEKSDSSHFFNFFLTKHTTGSKHFKLNNLTIMIEVL